MLNRKGSRQCRRIVVQEQGVVDGSLKCSLALGLVAAETRGSIAARQAAGTLPWIGVNAPAEEQRLQVYRDCRSQHCRSQQISSWVAKKKLTGAHDPQHALQKSGGLADQWYTDDGGIMCHPNLVLPFLQDFDVANARVGDERNPLKQKSSTM